MARTSAARSRKSRRNIEMRAVVDELGHLGDQLVGAKKIMAEYNKLRLRFLEMVTEHAKPEDSVVATGERYIAAASACSTQKVIADRELLYRALGKQVFMELASFKMDDLKQHLTPTQLNKVVKEENTGPRRVTVASAS
jgi:hypothetical protein